MTSSPPAPPRNCGAMLLWIGATILFASIGVIVLSLTPLFRS